LAIVVDNSLSMSLADPSGQPRYARGARGRGRLRPKRFDAEPGVRTALDLFDINGQPLNDGLPDQRRKNAPTSRWPSPYERNDSRSRLVLGLGLNRDGMDNTGRRDFRNLDDITTTIYALGFQAETAVGDLDLGVPHNAGAATVMVHNTAKVEVLAGQDRRPPRPRRPSSSSAGKNFHDRKSALRTG